MNLRILALAAVLAVGLIAAGRQAHAQTFTVIDIGRLPNTTVSKPASIDASDPTNVTPRRNPSPTLEIGSRAHELIVKIRHSEIASPHRWTSSSARTRTCRRSAVLLLVC